MKQLIKYPPGAYQPCAAALQDIGTLPAGHVQRGADGVPTGWRLLPLGKFKITQEGQEFEGELDAEIAGTMLSQAAAKGTPVPLDLHHNLKVLADTLEMDEGDLAKVLPQGVLTIGFGRLRLGAPTVGSAAEPSGRSAFPGPVDGLWLDAVEWTDVGRKLIGAGLFRYFSPVIRGLADGRYRITSVTLTNNPAIQGLDAIAAEDGGTGTRTGTDGETGTRTGTDGHGRGINETDGGGRVLRLADLVTRAVTPKAKGEQMKELLAKLGAMLGVDTIALTDDGKAPAAVETKLAALATELPQLRLLAGTAGKVRDALALTADAGEGQILAALQGLQAKGQAHDGLKARVDALALEAEGNKRTKVIERGMAEGKLTKAMIDNWAKGQDAAALEAFLQHAPVVVAPGKLVNAGALPAEADSLALSDTDRKVVAGFGYTPEQVEAAMKKYARG